MKKSNVEELVLLLCTVVLPPLGVFLKVGPAANFWLNLLLTVFGFYILGLIHGLYVILKK